MQRAKSSGSGGSDENTQGGWTQNDILDAVEGTDLGRQLVERYGPEVQRVIVYDGPGLSDFIQSAIFIDQNQPLGDAIQQFMMELSNFSNRWILDDLDGDVGRGLITRARFIEMVERVEHAGVINVIRFYDNARSAGQLWALGTTCVYQGMRDLPFDQYFAHVSDQHKARIGARFDQLRNRAAIARDIARSRDADPSDRVVITD